MAGFEPATPRLEVWCAIHCATRAKVSPGLEPGLSDSKSEMLTITSRNLLAGLLYIEHPTNRFTLHCSSN